MFFMFLSPPWNGALVVVDVVAVTGVSSLECVASGRFGQEKVLYGLGEDPPVPNLKNIGRQSVIDVAMFDVLVMIL